MSNTYYKVKISPNTYGSSDGYLVKYKLKWYHSWTTINNYIIWGRKINNPTYKDCEKFVKNIIPTRNELLQYNKERLLEYQEKEKRRLEKYPLSTVVIFNK